jgi:DNA-binding response OmpR family regulator
MYSVLLIDDDGKLAEVLSEYCAKFGIRIEPALLPSRGFEKLKKQTFDAIILDIMLPEMDGFEVCKKLRQSTDIPIIMLTARGDVTDRIVGLELGADDYLPKPFDPRELVARLQVNIKRHQNSNSSFTNSTNENLFFDGLSIHTLQRQVHVNNSSVDLTTMEYSLLLLLGSSPGKAYSRDQILADLKGTDVELISRSVDILVSRLRAKLRPLQVIQTIHGAGYAFVLQPKPETSG